MDPQLSALERALGVQYQVLRLLGRGGMGAVYLGRETALDRQVAIKVLPPEMAGNRESQERFRREARTAARLTHPNIVPLYTFGETEGLLFFVMGYVEGESLGTKLQREGRLDPDEARRILGEIADALDYAHRQGVVHRDIKPDNILLDRATGRPMLTDFGVARARASGATLTEAGAVVGTAHYMSPEQASGERDIDGRSDLYALGVVGYRMLSGRLPFEGEGFRELLVQHVVQPPPSLASLAPDTPSDLEIAVMRALQKDPADRWQDGAAFRGALGGDDLPDSELTGLRRRLNLGLFKNGVGFLLNGIVAGVAWLKVDNPAFLWWMAGLLVFGPLIEWGIIRYAVRRKYSMAELRVLYLRPPRWWPFWWPTRWRRRGDVYDRLPAPIRQARALRLTGFGLTYSFILFLFVFFKLMHPTLHGPLRTVLMAGLAVHMGGILLTLIWSAWRLERWGKRHGLDSETSANLGTQSTSDRAFWARAPYASLLGSVGSGKAVGEPDRPGDYLRAIGLAAAQLSGPAGAIGAEAITAARELGTALEALEREIATLSQDADPAELAAVERKLGELGPAATTEAESRRQVRSLLEGQRALLHRLGNQLAGANARHAYLLTLLRSLWLQLAALRADAAADAHRDGEVTGRLRAVIAEIERHAEAAAIVDLLTKPDPSTPTE